MRAKGSCPVCEGEAALRPVRYGLPDTEVRELAERGEVHLGGCVLGDDDAPYHCARCGAAVWWHGVFGRDREERVVRLGGLEWRLHGDGALTVADAGGGGMMLGSEDAEVLLLTLAVEVFADGESLVRWLRRHRLDFAGDAVGALHRFRWDDAGLHVTGVATDVVVLTTGRLLLGLLRDVLGDGRMSLGEAATWLAERGLAAPMVEAD
jgi:hypothetical protein